MPPPTPVEPTTPLFDETGASGNSHKNMWTRFAGARRCLHVTVTQTEVWVRPSFPFNFLAGFYDLEYRLPRNTITGATLANHPFIGTLVLLDFRLANGTVRRFQLRLSNPNAFLAAIKE